MRLARLLLVITSITILAGIAVGQESKTDQPKADAQQNDVKPVPPPDSANPLESFKDGQTFTYHGMPFRFDKKNLRLVPEVSAFDLTNDCLVMHTIRVARDSKDSDSTHVVEVTNCTPAKRFEMKSAVAVQQQK